MLQLVFGVVLGLSQGITQAADYVDVLDLPAREIGRASCRERVL